MTFLYPALISGTYYLTPINPAWGISLAGPLAVSTIVTTGTINAGGVITGTSATLTKTTEQLRLAYDGSNYVGITVSSAANITFVPTGTGGSYFEGAGIVQTRYGSNALIVTRRADGTKGSETALVTGDWIGGFSGQGWTGAAFSGKKVSVLFYAAENWSGSVSGTYMTFELTPVGTNTVAEQMRLDTTGLGIGTTPTAKLHVVSTTEQLRLGYSSTVYSSQTVAATTGLLTFGGAGTLAGVVSTAQYRLTALNTAPSSAGDTGTLGEIRIDASAIYVCTATNTWKKVAIATW